jgi:hypothetical protein
MKFMCLVWFKPGDFDGVSEAERTRITDATIETDHALRAKGRLILTQPLKDPEHAITLEVRGDKVSTHDGPFIETKEWLGGFFLIDARDMDEAIAVAREYPVAKVGSIEIRPTDDPVHSRTGQPRPEPKQV